MYNIKKRYSYQQGGFNSQQFSQGVGALGSFVSELDNTSDGPSIGSGVASGAAQGASLGAAAGPWGAVIGGVAGGIYGGVSANMKRKEIAQQKERANRLQVDQIRNYSQSVLQGYPTMGVEVAGYYANGGKVPTWLTNSLAEGGEVMVSDTPPQTDSFGDTEQLASNVSQFEGASHQAPSGGIGFNPTSDTYIFSDSLRNAEGLTYAKSAELIGKQKGKFEKKLSNAVDEAARNTAERMIYKLDQKLANLFQEQETLKANETI